MRGTHDASEHCGRGACRPVLSGSPTFPGGFRAVDAGPPRWINRGENVRSGEKRRPPAFQTRPVTLPADVEMERGPHWFLQRHGGIFVASPLAPAYITDPVDGALGARMTPGQSTPPTSERSEQRHDPRRLRGEARRGQYFLTVLARRQEQRYQDINGSTSTTTAGHTNVQSALVEGRNHPGKFPEGCDLWNRWGEFRVGTLGGSCRDALRLVLLDATRETPRLDERPLFVSRRKRGRAPDRGGSPSWSPPDTGDERAGETATTPTAESKLWPLLRQSNDGLGCHVTVLRG
ncbi:hypothetical protein HPB47_020888 [Ixodes persulcatus]|uniref:Uncharacterized protein n=1 Tax=Ixodes persulcatus TaxID=34615 RepID=A0AC60QEE7_IXOPE|nr:hypothetical protein HPB47_020888 [Ixodes persulcatus]